MHIVLDVRFYSCIIKPRDLHWRLLSEFFLGYIDSRISIQMSNRLLNPIIPGILNQSQFEIIRINYNSASVSKILTFLHFRPRQHYCLLAQPLIPRLILILMQHIVAIFCILI